MLITLTGCSKKDPEIIIKASDVAGNAVHYVKSDTSFYNWYKNNVDIDGDHFSDFYFATYFQHSPASYFISYAISALNNGQLSFVSVDAKGYPILLKKGDKIDGSLNWSDSKNLYLYYTWFSGYPGGGTYLSGNWSNVTNGYRGFKILRGNKTCYGWMRLDVDSYQNDFYLKDYAYIEY